MGFRYIATRRDGPVEHLTLTRPDVRNAFNDEMVGELAAWAAAARADRAIRCVVLSGAGKTFCAGADVASMAQSIRWNEDQNLQAALAMSRMFGALNSLPSAVIGRVHGGALGGGAGLVAVCDIVVAEERAAFGFTEVKLGILPAVISPFVLAKIGRSAARDLFLTGARFSAQRAREIGLVHTVVPDAALDSTVGRYVQEILTAGPEAVAAAKALIPQVWAHSVDAASELTASAIAHRRVSPEAQEGLHAFLEKRKPSWHAGSPEGEE